MDYFLLNVTLPALSWIYHKMVDPSIDQLQTLRKQYARDIHRKNRLDYINTFYQQLILTSDLPPDLASLSASYLDPQHKYWKPCNCFWCKEPYISPADMCTSACSGAFGLFLGIVLLVVVVYYTWRVGSWLNV